MPTEKQRAASRANGARSRGPKTPEGKARFDELVELLNSSLRPKTEMDRSLGDREMRLDRQFFRTFDRYFKMQKFFDETNPASTSQPELSAFPGSRFEPAETQREPGETQTEPGETRTEPGETQLHPNRTSTDRIVGLE
jgi:hypothetical protein